MNARILDIFLDDINISAKQHTEHTRQWYLIHSGALGIWWLP